MSNSAARFLQIQPGGVPAGEVPIPGDKSISHRALICSALAEGVSEIHGFLNSADCLALSRALAQLGVTIDRGDCGELKVHGRGFDGMIQPQVALDLGNSGTAIRLLTGVLAGQPFHTLLTGDESLRRRPMQRVADPLIAMGAHVETTSGCAPLEITGKRPLRSIKYKLPVASAQIKSALLYAGLFSEDGVVIVEPKITRDHTERMLRLFGIHCEADSGNTIRLSPGPLSAVQRIDVPGDLSSAAFFMVAAAICPGAEIHLPGVGVNPSRNGVVRLLMRMGADIEHSKEGLAGEEPVADITVRGPENLKGIDINADDVALSIDEIPAVLIAAACAKGRTTVAGAGELRVKESDRIAAMEDGLAKLGVNVGVSEDGIWVDGGELRGGEINSRGDHRIAMAFAVAGIRATDPVRVIDTENIATSFPDFVACLKKVGITVKEGVAAPV